jgi:hypothetical protein
MTFPLPVAPVIYDVSREFGCTVIIRGGIVPGELDSAG